MITFRFSNGQQQPRNISIDYSSSLRDENDLNENFHLSYPLGLTTYLEYKVFYFLDVKKWTLNELLFFVNNNNLCLELIENDSVIKSYGACTVVLLSDFNGDFNNDFN